MATLHLSSFGNCVINIWEGAPETAALAELEEYCRKVAAENGETLTLLTVLEEGAPFINAAQRKELEGFYARLAPLFSGVGQVVEGSTMWSVTARSVMTAMRLVQKRGYPVRVFSDADVAVNWLSEIVRQPASITDADQISDQFKAEVHSMRRKAA